MFGWIGEQLGLGDTQSAADHYQINPDAYTWGLDADISARDREAFWQRGEGTFAAQQDARARQMALADQLQRQARGEGPSLAEAQLHDALARSNAQSMSMAASAPPSQGALAMRQAMMANAMGSQQAASTAAQARIAEQMAAQQQLAALLGQTRGQDLGAFGQTSGQYMDLQRARLAAAMAESDRAYQLAGGQAGAHNEEQARRAQFWGEAFDRTLGNVMPSEKERIAKAGGGGGGGGMPLPLPI